MSTTEWIRTDHVARLEADFDTLVIGAGITGAGVALDLASRGLSVAVVDQADFAHGTSSRSTKLLHGGIRYLPHFEFHLVSEGLREQKVLARVADFLFDETEFVIPLYTQYGLADAPRWASGPRLRPLALAAGLTLYDILGGIGRPGHRHRRVTSDHLLEKMPHLATEGLRGGFIYSDAQTEDSRLVVSVAKTAVRRFGAVAAGGGGWSGYRSMAPDTGFTCSIYRRADPWWRGRVPSSLQPGRSSPRRWRATRTGCRSFAARASM